MNDFTKEELEELHYLANYYIEMNITVHDEATQMRDKLQSMIDNYCEHSDSEPNHNYEVEQCKKCGARFV